MKRTKTKLVSSIVTLLVCFAMLVGSTFAWFTDSVSTGVNTIQAGNLDIEVEYQVKDSEGNITWDTIQDKDSLFSADLWEPGHTEFVTLKIQNKGTLALKYKVLVTPVSERGGVNVNGVSFKLSDYMVFGTTEPSTTLVNYTRETVRDAVGNTTGLANVNSLTEEKIMNPTDVQYITLAVYMPETIGNDANYKTGTEAPKIDLGIKVLATQVEKENDSFDNNYDADADTDSFYTVGSYYDYFPQVLSSSEPITIVGDNQLGGESETIIEAKGKLNSNDAVETTLAKVTIPVGTKLEENTSVLTVKVTPQEPNETTTSRTELQLELANPDREIANFDVKVLGVASDNDTNINVEVFVGKGLANVNVYHNGSLINNANYDPVSGIVKFVTSTFSDYTVAFDAAVAAIGTDTYGSLQLAINAAQNGDTVKLLKNIILAETLIFNKTYSYYNKISLDLNDKTIIGDNVRAIKVACGTLDIKGKGMISSTGIEVGDSVIRVGDNEATGTSKLYVQKDVSIITDCSYGIVAFGAKNEYVHVYGEVTSTAPENASYDGCAISTLGNDTTTSYIYIYNGASIFASNTNAIYMPSGNLTVYDGATVTGRTGIYVKSGTTTIKGGVITGNGEAVEYNYYGNGGISTGDALVVDSCGYPNGKPSVSVAGGTFISEKANAVGSYNKEGNDLVTSFITGGIFSNNPGESVNLNYRAINTDGMWHVSYIETTEEDPIIISDENDFKYIISGSSSKKRYYKLNNDIDMSELFETEDYAIYRVGNIIFDGNDKTISGVNDGYLFNEIYNSTIKNLTVDLNGFESAISLEAQNSMLYENVDVIGELDVTGNCGAYTIYAYKADFTFESCVANVDMSGTSYNAVFIGNVYASGNTFVSKFNFNNCENSGSLVCNYASMFIGNPNTHNIECNVTNCLNSGSIQATNTNQVFNYYYSVTSNCYGKFVINGVEYNDIADGRSSAPSCFEDTNVITSGQAVQGPQNTGMTIVQNDDFTFTITDANIEGKTVDHYTVYVGVYASLKAGGSNRNYATETISANEQIRTTALKNLAFVDSKWIETHPDAVSGDLAGNETYTLDNETYYMLKYPETDTLNGSPKAPQMIYVVAFDSNNKTLASAMLLGNIA